MHDYNMPSINQAGPNSKPPAPGKPVASLEGLGTAILSPLEIILERIQRVAVGVRETSFILENNADRVFGPQPTCSEAASSQPHSVARLDAIMDALGDLERSANMVNNQATRFNAL